MSKNLSALSSRKGLEENLFEQLGNAAQSEGSPSKEDLHRIAKDFLMGDTNTYSTITAYDFMKPENRDKKIYVCNGSACLCAGTQQGVHEKIEKHFAPEAIGHMTCLGRCHENSAFHFDGKNYSGNSINQLEQILKQNTTTDNMDRYAVRATTPLLTLAGFDTAAYEAQLSAAINRGADALLNEVKQSQIRGRGGAGFPAGIKWESCKKEQSDIKFVVCNADEGDPGAYSDRYLLEEHPLKVLFGMTMAGYITGAQWGVLYIRAEYPEAVERSQQAINSLLGKGLLGKNILNTSFDFNIKIIKAKGAYICGEETALINSIEGQRPEVRTKPPFPTVQGLFMKPTVMNNVETLASIAWILEHSGQAYAAIGTERSKGTKLVCLDGHFNNPGIFEVAMGTSLEEVVDKLGGGFKHPVKALHIGGPLGGIVPVEKIKDLSIDFESFGSQGFLLGHASVVSIPQDFPMINYLEHLFEFASFESCGKCFPCRLGTRRAFELLESAANKKTTINKELFTDLLDTLQKGSLCAHGGGIPLPARNAIQYFSQELEPYFN